MNEDSLNHWELDTSSQCKHFIVINVLTPMMSALLTREMTHKLRWLSTYSGIRPDNETLVWNEPRMIKVSIKNPIRPNFVECTVSGPLLLEGVQEQLMSHDSRDLLVNWQCDDEQLMMSGLAVLRGGVALLPNFALVALVHEPGGTSPGPWAVFLSESFLRNPDLDSKAFESRGHSQDLGHPPELSQILTSVQSRLAGFCLPSLNQLGAATCKLARVISHLRAPGGCPWDREQSFESLRPFLIEEAYEANAASAEFISAPRESAALAFADELGDVLLQIVLNAQLASESHHFDLITVVESLTAKMIRRHPHVFASDSENTAISSPDDVKALWETVKGQERDIKTSETQSVQSRLLSKALKKSSLPSLDYAATVSRRASKFGFCWTELDEVWSDVESEIRELREELLVKSPDFNRVEDEIGDVCFALANVIIHCQNHLGAPQSLSFDDALRKSIAKFAARFAQMEAIFEEENSVPLDESVARSLTLDTWNSLWKKAKLRRYR